MCPFWFCEYDDSLSDLGAVYLQALIGEIVTPPPPDPEPEYADLDLWSLWWDEYAGDWTAEQRHAVWDLFDKLRFYDVVELPLED